MKLTKIEEKRANAIHSRLKRMNIHELAKNKIFTCSRCRGTGLQGIYLSKKGGISGWDCKSFCPDCKGIGYTGNFNSTRKLTETTYLCKYCYGAGCLECKGSGTVDWVKFMMGG